jgi:hypothetical protein
MVDNLIHFVVNVHYISKYHMYLVFAVIYIYSMSKKELQGFSYKYYSLLWHKNLLPSFAVI